MGREGRSAEEELAEVIQSHTSSALLMLITNKQRCEDNLK